MHPKFMAGIIRQFHRRSVNCFQKEGIPCQWIGRLVEVLDRLRVEFDEGLGLELFFCIAKNCLGGNVPGHRLPRKNLSKLVEFGLVGAFDQVAKVQDQRGERQFSVAGEV